MAPLPACCIGGWLYRHWKFSAFYVPFFVAGIIQILLGVAKLGGIANYIPSSVIKGMLTSIGILIIAKQIPHAFGWR